MVRELIRSGEWWSRKEICAMVGSSVRRVVTAFAFMIASELLDEEPRHYRESWKPAMIEELKSLKENETWTMVDKPHNKKIIGSRWIFKVKEGIPSVEAPIIFKARLVVKGFSQRERVDYNERFALRWSNAGQFNIYHFYLLILTSNWNK